VNSRQQQQQAAAARQQRPTANSRRWPPPLWHEPLPRHRFNCAAVGPQKANMADEEARRRRRREAAAAVARAAAQAEEHAEEGLRVDGFPARHPQLRALNGLWTRGEGDFANYRPHWGRGGGRFFLYHHAEAGWVFSDTLRPDGHGYWARAISTGGGGGDGGGGGVPMGEATSWRVIGPPAADVSLRIVGGGEAGGGMGCTAVPGPTHHAAAARIQAAQRGAAVRRRRQADAAAAAASAAAAAAGVAGQLVPEPELSAAEQQEQRVTRLQALWRGRFCRQLRRWAAEEPESLATLTHFLKVHGVGRLVPHFRWLHVTWEVFVQLTPKRLGGVMFPHVDFGPTCRWDPSNGTGRISWGLEAELRRRLNGALRRERIRAAGRKRAEQSRREAAEAAEAQEALRAQRQLELEAGQRRAIARQREAREAILGTMRGAMRAREREAARRDALETTRAKWQGSVAAQERRRHAAEVAKRAERWAGRREQQQQQAEQDERRWRRRAQREAVRVGDALTVLSGEALQRGGGAVSS
jgi:hypothetical protein